MPVERLPAPCAELAGPEEELTDPVGVGASELVGPAWGAVVVGCALDAGEVGFAGVAGSALAAPV